MTTNESIASARWSTFQFLAAQIVPPVAMFLFVFGHWGIGVAFVIGPPMLYSAFRVPLLLYRKQFRRLLRPVLTLLFALTIIQMGGYYATEAAKYVDQLAREMQQQCNRDGICKLPPGEWTPSDGYGYPTLFYSHTKGLVPISIVLTFNEYEPNKQPPCAEAAPQPRDCPGKQSQETLRFTAFHLTRQVEDHNYHVYGGVGRSLNIPGADEYD